MKVEYSKRALSDLARIASYYRTVAGTDIAAEAEARIRAVLARVSRQPESAPIVPERPGLRAVLLIGFPYKIFYRVAAGRIQVAHIRHTSRKTSSNRGR